MHRKHPKIVDELRTPYGWDSRESHAISYTERADRDKTRYNSLDSSRVVGSRGRFPHWHRPNDAPKLLSECIQRISPEHQNPLIIR